MQASQTGAKILVAGKAWEGVFAEATDRRVEQFSESISFDKRLYVQDIVGSQAHARMLAKVGLLTEQECQSIVQGLEEIRQEIESGTFAYCVELEDIHMHIEKALIDRLGDVGRKLHTARSRNDQISTDLRLWIRDAIDRTDTLLLQVQQAFVGRCEKDGDVIMPAYTHMRRAQPVLAPHYWLAWCEKFQRDRGRLQDCRRRVNVLSLGTAALAGTSLPIDREHVREQLGFDSLMANSLDVSSDRDFVVESVFCLSMVAEHLSSWADEWVLWSTTEYGFLQLPESFCTGSSIMPQKVNPDVLELIRGKTARVLGALQTLLVLIKGLPLAYNRDLQEDKPPLFDAFDTVQACLELAAPLIAQTELNRKVIASGLEDGYLDATTLMEHFILQGLPQRTAHGFVGKLVRMAMDRGVALAELPQQDIQSIYPAADETITQALGTEQAVRAFVSHGSTAPDQVKVQVDLWKERLAAEDLASS